MGIAVDGTLEQGVLVVSELLTVTVMPLLLTVLPSYRYVYAYRHTALLLP